MHQPTLNSVIHGLFLQARRSIRWNSTLLALFSLIPALCLQLISPASARSSTSQAVPLDTPSLLTPGYGSEINDNTPTLEWVEVPGADQYQVQVDNDWPLFSPEIDVTQPGSLGSAFTLTDPLADSVGYYGWRVRAIEADGNPGPWSAVWVFWIDTVPPKIPTLILPVDQAVLSTGRPSFTWTSHYDADTHQHQIQVDDQPDFASPLIDQFVLLALESYSPDTELPANTYYWRVQALDKSGNPSGFSPTRTVTVDPSYDEPTSLTAVVNSSTEIALSWTDNSSSGTMDFHIERSLAGSGDWIEIGETYPGFTRYDDRGLNPSTTYEYRIRGHRSEDNDFSEYSNIAQATTFFPIVSFSDNIINLSEAAGAARLEVVLSGAVQQTVTVEYITYDYLTTAGEDYTNDHGTLTFNPGQTSQVIEIPITNDQMDELDETFDIYLRNPVNADLGNNFVYLTLTDDDLTPTIGFDSPTYTVSENSASAMITVTLSAPSGKNVRVGYATSDGTATAGSDYTAASGTLTFTPGQISQTFSIPISSDGLNESNETVNLSLISPSNAILGNSNPAVLTIEDDDPLPSVQFSASVYYNVSESSGSAIITVNSSAASGQMVTVDYATDNGYATAGSDYTAASGTLTFTPNQTSQTFSIPINNDSSYEGIETVNLSLSSPVNATLGILSSAVLYIQDDDDLPPATPVLNEETRTGGSSGSITVKTGSNLAGVNGNLYLAAISTRPRVSVSSVTGLGLTWTYINSQCSGRNTTGIEVWMAQGNPTSSSGTVTALFSAKPSHATIAVSRYSGVATTNPIGNIVAANTRGLDGPCSGGVDTKSYYNSLTTGVNGAVAYVVVGMPNRTHTAGSGYTERAEKTQGSSVSVAVEDRVVAAPSTVPVNGGFNDTADWAQIALAIKPSSAPQIEFVLTLNVIGRGSVTMNPPRVRYAPGTLVRLAATNVSGWRFTGWSGDVGGSFHLANIIMNGNKSITATFTQLPAAIAQHEETVTGGSSSSQTVATSASLNGVSGELYLAAVSSNPRLSVSSVSGLGLIWTRVKAQCSGRNTEGIEVWMAQGTPASSGVVTAQLAGAATHAAIAVSRYSGVAATNPVGNIVSGNTRGLDGSCSGGVDSSSYTFNLTTSANGALAYVAVNMRDRTHSPGAGYTERAEVRQGTQAASVAIADRPIPTASTVAVNGTLSGSTDWSMIVLEIKPAGP